MAHTHDFTVFIGRFQPFHAGHLKVVRQALAQSDKLIVLLGSAWQARNPRNPLSFQEREQMLRACLDAGENARVLCQPLMDVPYNDAAWIRNAQSTVAGLVAAHYSTPHRPARIALIGHQKDHTGFYLSLFPQWGSLAVDNPEQLNATDIRTPYFLEPPASVLDRLCAAHTLPAPVATWLQDFAERDPAYSELCEEIGFIHRYRQAWADAPYAPTFVTVDAAVVQSGHILLVERRARPGKGLLALPGGFANADERLVDGCLRELREETRLKVPAPILKGSIKRCAVYDDPHRSARGRTITHAFHIELPAQAELPRVKGGDDAKHAFWQPLGELHPEHMFEDHYFIIQDLLGTP